MARGVILSVLIAQKIISKSTASPPRENSQVGNRKQLGFVQLHFFPTILWRIPIRIHGHCRPD